MLTTILDCTNREMEIVRATSGMSDATRARSMFSDTNLTEIKALIGVLIMTGVRHDGHLNLKMMFDVQFGALFYRSLFSLKRFEWLLRTLRFDHREERDSQ